MKYIEMKFSDEAKKRVVEEIDIGQKELNDTINQIKVKMIEEDLTPRRFLELKLLLITTSLESIPLSSRACIFCQEGRIQLQLDNLEGPPCTFCWKCPYGRVHGSCLDDNSDYDIVMTSLEMTKALFDRLFYNATEKYEMEVEEGE